MKKVNLVFFLPNFGIGGAGKSITSLCHNLNRNKFSITIICLKHCYYKKILNKACTKIYELNNSKASFAQFKIKKILEDLHVEIVNSETYCMKLENDNFVVMIDRKNDICLN